MLVTNPAARAPLSEVLNHPWMQRGYRGPPDSHLVHREPLRAEDLDRNVIRGMKGFEFGSEEEIEKKLIEVLESDAYFRAVQHWERKRSMANGRNGKPWIESMSNSSLAVSFDGTTLASSSPANGSRYDHNSVTSSPSKKSRRFSGFDFSSYRKKLFSPGSSPPTTPMHSPPTSQSHLSHSSLTDASQREPADPTYGFHPLISIYFLSREKMERERVYGPGHFASSQLSLESRVDPSSSTDPPAAPPPTAKNLSQPVIPKNNGMATAKQDYSMPLPRLPAPETSHFSGMSYEPSAATPSPTAAQFPQPRARDPALSNLVVTKREMADTHSVPSSPIKTNMPSLPRAPQASAHKRSHSLSQRPSVSRGWAGMFGGGPAPNPVEEMDENGTIRASRREMLEPPKTAGPELSAFADQMEKSQQQQEQQQQDDSYRLPSPISAGATLVRKFGSLLGGPREGSIRHSTAKRGSIFTGGFSPRPSGEVGDYEKKSQHGSSLHNGEVSEKENEHPTPQITTEAPTPIPSPDALTHSQSQPIGNTHRRAATIMDPASRHVRHERRSSTGAAFFSNVGGTIGRHRRPSTGGYGYTQPRSSTAERAFGRTEEVDEQGEVQEEGEDTEHGVLTNGADKENKVAGDISGDEKEFKPVFLKGLFR